MSLSDLLESGSRSPQPADLFSNSQRGANVRGAVTGTHLDYRIVTAVLTVSQRFKSIVALWFALQIVLPFTAPVNTCDLGDLLGTEHQHRAPESSDRSTRPTMPGEAESDADSFVSPLAASSLRASTSLAVVRHVALSGPFMATFGLSPSPQVQPAVLRV